jgi:hypothetical protein
MSHHTQTYLRSTARLALVLTAGAVFPAAAFGQADLIGARGGLPVPTVPGVSTTPLLPPGLNLPPVATNSLLNGLNASGTALRPGMGWLVSGMTQQGVRGQQLADIINQLKPYKQRGVLTFPQATNPAGLPLPTPGVPQPTVNIPGLGGSQGLPLPALNRGQGKGGGKGNGKGGKD